MIAAPLISAWQGRRVWIRLRRRFNVDQGVYVVALIEDDPELNNVALNHLPELIDDRRARGVVIVTDQRQVVEQAADRPGVLAVVPLTDREVEALLTFYELHQFTPRLLFVSLTRPHGNRLARMQDVNGLTLDDLVCLCMYRMRAFAAEVPSHV